MREPAAGSLRSSRACAHAGAGERNNASNATRRTSLLVVIASLMYLGSVGSYSHYPAQARDEAQLRLRHPLDEPSHGRLKPFPIYCAAVQSARALELQLI